MLWEHEAGGSNPLAPTVDIDTIQIINTKFTTESYPLLKSPDIFKIA